MYLRSGELKGLKVWLKVDIRDCKKICCEDTAAASRHNNSRDMQSGQIFETASSLIHRSLAETQNYLENIEGD